MKDIDGYRLRSWEDELDHLAAAIRARKDRLDQDQAICLQLEASLIELTHENESTTKSLDQIERQLSERRLSLEKRLDDLGTSLAQAEETLRRQRDRQEASCNDIEEGWRAIEDELKSMDSCHAYEVARLKKSQRELEDRENMLRERMRALSERESEILGSQRRLRNREALFREMNNASINRKLGELQERESLLHNEGLP